MSKKRIMVKQHDATDCGAACLSMVCFNYGKELSITKLRDILGTDIKGTTLAGLERACSQLCFLSKSLRVDKESFKSKFSLPAIAHLITEEGLSHFVVVRKIKKDKVWFSDPAKGNKKSSINDFFKSFDGVLLLLVPNEEFFKSKEKRKSVYSRYSKLLLAQKKLFVYAIITSFILTGLGIVSSLFNKFLMDEILPYSLKKELLIYIIAFGLIALTQTGVGFIRSHMLLYLSQKIDIPLVLGYFKHVFKLPMKFFSTRKTGDILTRFSDSFTIKNVLSGIYLTIIIDVVMAIASAIILYMMNAQLFAVIIVLTLISAALIYIFKRPYKKINLEQMEQSARLNSSIIESLKGIETIKGNANEERTMEKIEHDYIKSVRIVFKEGFLSNIQGSISSIISTGGNLVLMYIGAMQVMNGNITLGTLLAFTSLSGFFMDPIGRLIGLQLQIQEAGISMKRISEILDVEEEQENTDDGVSVEKLEGDIVFNNVTFRYGYRSPVLKNISMTIPKGKKVALVGGSGSGKTTISKLLLRFFDAEDGTITVNETEINSFNIQSLRRSIGYVPQNIELFSGSIIDNLRVGNPYAKQEDIENICKITGCDEFINKMPARYQSFLEEAGGGLSGGEKQRLALARALLKKSDFIILDEATSNLDFISESKIYDAIFNKLNDKTMLIIAHRLSTIRNCDIIYVLDNGKIVETGTHQQLLNNNSIYTNLWESQVGKTTTNKQEDTTKTDVVIEDDEDTYTYN